MMPYDYEPKRSRVHRLLMPTLSDSERRFFWYRDHLKYDGWIDQDGYPS